MGKSKTLILIDGHALAFRQYYALERTNMKTKDGTPTWAVYGFFKAIFDLLKNENLNPDAIGVAFDVSHHTFRTEKYEEYKANRSAMPDAMQIQMGLIFEGLKAFNIPIYTKEGFEADDVIGTISKRACELGHQVYILTGDQDSFQLIRENGCVKVIIPSKGELLEYDWQKVFEKLGVYPNQVIDYKALRGDTSDNIPGVKGIGEKTAVKLLDKYKTVDEVLKNADNIEGKSIREKIKNGIEQARLSKYLATIVQDVDISFDFEKTAINLPEITVVTDFFRSMQFYSFLKNIELILKLFDKNIDLDTISTILTNNEKSVNENNLLSTSSKNGQLELFANNQAEVVETNFPQVKLIVDTTDFERLQEKIIKSSVFAIKTYAQVKNAVEFDIYGISIGLSSDFKFEGEIKTGNELENFEIFYIPLNHNLENQLDTNFVIENLKPILENSEIKKITHDVKLEYCIYKNFEILLNGVVFDTMLACYIKNSNANSSFDIQCMEQINHILPTIVTDNKKSNFNEQDIDFVKKYISEANVCLYKLTKYWYENLTKKEFSILTDIEIPLAQVLSEMEYVGISVDTEYLSNLSQNLSKKASVLEKRIYEISQEVFNINSPKQVASILFDKLQLKTTKKRGKSKNSTSADILNSLAKDYEIARLILEYRKYNKLKSTYTEALPVLVSKKDGRIHTTFNQTVTTTGRLSSSNPNLQNIPIRTEDGNKIRQAFVPKNREECLILSADYSQIELRLLAHVSKDENLINAFKSGTDVHTLTASKVFGVNIEDVTKDMRYKSKAVNFGIVYGQSKYGLAKSLDITLDEAEYFITKYFETYPRIQEYMNNMVQLVEEQGYVETIFGRRRYLEKEINSPNAMIREFAKRAGINQPMQGSASDLIKIAMIDFSNKLKENNLKSKMVIQVHDELVVEVYKDELEKVKELIKSAMELSQPLLVPLLVDINVGESWKEL